MKAGPSSRRALLRMTISDGGDLKRRGCGKDGVPNIRPHNENGVVWSTRRTAAAEAVERSASIAALKRCATQKLSY
jgi:hypothetical protein